MGRAPTQLDAELEYFRRIRNFAGPSGRLQTQEIIDRIEKLLQSSELAKVLLWLEEQNERLMSQPPLSLEERRLRSLEGQDRPRTTPFLLGPYLYQAFGSVKDREFVRTHMPILKRPPAQVRAHFQKASAKSKDLAKMLREGLQPRVVLGAQNQNWESVWPFTPVIQSQNRRAEIVLLADLIESAAESLGSMACSIVRTKNTSMGPISELRARVASILVKEFRTHLGGPYHSHVATIASFLSGIHTGADYVKKIEKHRLS